MIATQISKTVLINFSNFLNNFKTCSSDDYTHIFMSHKLSIPDEQMPELYNNLCLTLKTPYKNAIIFKEKRNIDHTPLLINLNFKYDINYDLDKMRVRTKVIVKKIVREITEMLQYYLSDQNNFCCIVTMSKAPTVIDHTNVIVLNVCLRFPHLIVTNEFQKNLRLQYLKTIKESYCNILDSINDISDIYDINFLNTADVALYGTRTNLTNFHKILAIYNDNIFKKSTDRKNKVKLMYFLSVAKKNLQLSHIIRNGDVDDSFSYFKNKKELAVINICDKSKKYKKAIIFIDCDITKYYCKDYDGNMICRHMEIKYVCKKCQCTHVCIHGSHSVDCVLCNKNLICEHKNYYYYCTLCDPKTKCSTEECKNQCWYDLKYCSKCLGLKSRKNKILHVNKESIIVDLIKKEFPTLNWIHDQTVKGGVSRRRPDMRFEINKKSCTLIVEIDENKHIGYNKEIEIYRLKEIYTDLKKDHMIVIRFNPDAYIDKNNNVVKSCFSRNIENGSYIIKDVNEFNKRLEILFIMIEYWRKTNPTEQIILHELFY